MILQYEGFSKSKTQILEEAESISYTYVTIPEWVKKDIKREFDRDRKNQILWKEDFKLYKSRVKLCWYANNENTKRYIRDV